MVGHDAAVCVQKYEPWIIEVYNTSTGSSFVFLGVVGKGDGSTSLSPSGDIRGAQITNARYLNATGKDFVFTAYHRNSIYQFDDANKYGDAYYCFPTPTVGPIMPRVQHPL